MNHLAENMRYLIWASKAHRRNSTQNYSAYIEELSGRCCIDVDRFRKIISGDASATSGEVESVKRVFSQFDDEHARFLDTDYLYREAIEENKDLLVQENILYLLKSIPWGDNREFVEELGIQDSTLTRWKSGKMKPSKYYQGKICKYFGIPDVDGLKTTFLFLGLSPTTVTEKKLHLKRLLDGIDRERLEAMYPAIVKLLE